MTSEFNAGDLGKRLARLDSKRQLVFGISVCEGLVPTYARFESQEGWGNSFILREALRMAWSSAAGKLLEDPDSVSNLNERVEAAAPSSESFDSLYVTAAQDACFAVCALLDYIISPSLERMVQVAKYAIDSVDLYVQEVDSLSPLDPKLESRILNNPLMQRELQRQENILKFLETPRFLDDLAKVDLRQIAGADGEGCLGA